MKNAQLEKAAQTHEHADARRCLLIMHTHIRQHASEQSRTHLTANNLFLFATCSQPVFANDRRWHAEFPVPVILVCTAINLQSPNSHYVNAT